MREWRESERRKKMWKNYTNRLLKELVLLCWVSANVWGNSLMCSSGEAIRHVFIHMFAALWNEMFLGTGYTSIQFSSLEKIELQMIGTLFTMIIYYFFVWLEVVLFLATFSCFLFHRQCSQPCSKF
jgi:hypothetical protein